MKGKSANSLELVRLCCRVLDEKKAGDLRVLDVSAQSSITDYLVLATGTSDPHLRALRVELEKVIDATSNRIVGMETAQESGWIVIDVFDVMVHIFSAENRSKYGLENLWKDAVEVSVPALLGEAKPAKPAKPARKKAAAPTRRKAAKTTPAAKRKKSASK
ncbi:MAG TPA: ribosome silencing factor [Opitutaceae bacterium]|nr:ribosome silencing factor [Opitutaceae bacterium]